MIVFKLREILKLKGLSDKDLISAGMNRVTVRGLMSGMNTRIDFHILDHLCKTLDCQPGDLFEYRPD